jgi:polar amino acid transport system substrate-binding protein
MKKYFPFFTIFITILFLSCSSKDTEQQYTNLRDIGSGRIGVVLGTTHDKFVSENYKEANVLHFESNPDLILAIKARQADAVVGDQNILKPYLREDPELAVLEWGLFDQHLGFGFGDIKLRDNFNVYLNKLKESGKLKLIKEKWENADDNTQLYEHEFTGKNGILRIGITGVSIPFAYLSKGKYVGIDMELIYGFAASQGMKPELHTMQFPSLIASIVSEKVDIIGSPVTITEERKKQILFSDSYYTSASIAVTLKRNISGYTSNEEVSNKTGFAKIKDSFYNNIIKEKRYLLLWDGFKVTFIISILAAIFGTLLGALICWMRMSRNKIIKTIAIIYINILRGIPQVVLLMLMFYVVLAKWSIGGVTVAVITFSMNFAAYASEMFRTSIQSIKRGQTEAGIAMGFSKIKTFLNIVMPQAIQRVIPIYKGEFIGLVKMTSIVGYIAVQDLTKASDIIRSRTFDAFFPLIVISIIYFLLAWLLTLLLDMVQINVAPKRNR